MLAGGRDGPSKQQNAGAPNIFNRSLYGRLSDRLAALAAH